MSEEKKPVLTKIPLDTFYDYFVDDDGNVYKGDKKIGLWKNWPPPSKGDKPYWRCRLKMKDGTFKFFFAQRLMGYTFYDLKEHEIMRHGPGGTLDNSRTNLVKGSHKDNQGEDRLNEGNYFNRGPNPDPLLNEFATQLHKDVGF